MTQEEIEILQVAYRILDRITNWYHGISHELEIRENDIKAIEVAKIAIQALQTEQLKESQENFNKDSETESMLNADLISREAVIDEINRMGINAFATYNDYSGLFDFVDSLPSVTLAKDINVTTTDAISRQAAIDAIDEFYKCSGRSAGLNAEYIDGKEYAYNKVKDMVKFMLSVQPAQKVGKWEFLCHQNLKCSECGYVICEDDADEYKHCPKCGCRMLEEGE